MRLNPRRLFWGMVSLSALLHVAASVVPWPEVPTPSQSTADAQLLDPVSTSAIAISQLPTKAAPDSSKLSVSSSAPPKSAPQQQFPSIAPEPVVPPPLPVTPPVQSPVAAELPEEPLEQAESVDIDEGAIEQDHPQSLEDTQLPTEEQKTSEPEQGVLLQLAEDFPHLSGAQSGCYGLSQCHQSSGRYREVVRELTEQMRAKGYRLTEDHTIDGVGHRVFEVVIPDDPDSLYYLNVFSDGLDTAVYAITVNILTLNELKGLQA